MNVIQTTIEGVFIIEPTIHLDKRGYFFESFSQKDFSEKVTSVVFLQDNESDSVYGVLRGLHYQKEPFAQSKLVRVTCGKILDVVVDLRKNSPTFGQWFSVELSQENKKQLFIPKGMAHGFVTLSQKATVQYKCDAYYQPSHQEVLSWNCPTLSIDWQLPKCDIILSEKDENAPFFDEKIHFF